MSKYNIKVLYNGNNEKLCSKCKKYFSFDCYHSNGRDKDGKIKLRGECKYCRKVSNRKFYLKRTQKKNFIKELEKSLTNNDEDLLKKLLDNEENCKMILKILEITT